VANERCCGAYWNDDVVAIGRPAIEEYMVASLKLLERDVEVQIRQT